MDVSYRIVLPFVSWRAHRKQAKRIVIKVTLLSLQQPFKAREEPNIDAEKFTNSTVVEEYNDHSVSYYLALIGWENHNRGGGQSRSVRTTKVKVLPIRPTELG